MKARSHTQKKVIYLISIIVFVLMGAAMYLVIFVSDIPKTQPNVNHKPLHNLEMSTDTLHDHLNNKLGIIETGSFVVREDRESEKSNYIELYFERFKTTSKNPLTPIFFLAGGPGSSSTRIGKTPYFFLFKELSKYADVVLLDQRGTGKSIPNLECRNFLDFPVDIRDNVKEEVMKDLLEKCHECADEFNDMHINLNSYNSYESALDIEEIRKALRYNKIVLYGYSYGTELAQIYIKHFEKNVDKAILAGSIAPDHGLKLPFDIQEQYKKIDSLLKLDKKLSKYVPSFLSLVKQTHNRLKVNPVEIKIPTRDAFGNNPSSVEKTLSNIISLFNPTIDMTLTETYLQMMVSDKVGNDNAIKQLPNFYYKISQGNFREVGNNLRNFKRRRLPNALFFTANGTSRYSETLWNQAIHQDTSAIFSHFGISYGRYPEVYNAFRVTKIKGMNTPVYAHTKTLFMLGTLDGRAPERFTDTIAKRFPNNRKIILRNRGHNKLLNNETMYAVIRFLRDSLDTDISMEYKIKFKPPVPFKYSMIDTLYTQITKKGVQSAIDLYIKLHLRYGAINDYVFDFSEDVFHSIADRIIEVKDYQNAIDFLNFGIALHPEDYRMYRSLAKAYKLLDKEEEAKKYLKKALDCNFFDGQTQAMYLQLREM